MCLFSVFSSFFTFFTVSFYLFSPIERPLLFPYTDIKLQIIYIKEDFGLIRCKTTLDNDTIMALSKYHHAHKKDVKRKKIFTIILAIFLLIISSINAYGIWMKYVGTLSTALILLRASVFVILSLIILLNVTKGSIHNTYKELKKYFKKTNVEHIDYIITDEGIQMKINDNTTSHKWEDVDYSESDDHYIYFSSNGKHTLIAKAPMAKENAAKLEEMFTCLVK